MTSMDAALIALSVVLWAIAIAVCIPRSAAERFSRTAAGSWFANVFSGIERGISRVLKIRA
ncbi:hypothetical protein PP639_gp035 [Arthrobacter phage Seahorse]|uniref:Uncharacterized protein n=1 Tax=Arthrobacter phage Seahorse TaxID=2419611 RepID=A0A3G3M509_9CAUD|nr:hypothetical protein PP639_gp035 [Arthrobacter phage Seahorse]AYR01535.1 hypothetical protein PBI_SEAHORSE_35 [Arthrobacter phage Seahorse]